MKCVDGDCGIQRVRESVIHNRTELTEFSVLIVFYILPWKISFICLIYAMHGSNSSLSVQICIQASELCGSHSMQGPLKTIKQPFIFYVSFSNDIDVLILHTAILLHRPYRKYKKKTQNISLIWIDGINTGQTAQKNDAKFKLNIINYTQLNVIYFKRQRVSNINRSTQHIEPFMSTLYISAFVFWSLFLISSNNWSPAPKCHFSY